MLPQVRFAQRERRVTHRAGTDSHIYFSDVRPTPPLVHSHSADIVGAMFARRCLALVGACLLSPLAHAQQPWTAAESPTTQTLWGVASGDSVFVAVGEGGTILTSPDGVAWTARVSGTSRWLLAATWAPTVKTFVVVGEAGTILTSPDGIAWTPRTSGTTQRLNSVAWSPKRFTYPDVFLAVGESGTAVVSYDLATWSLRSTGDSGWLRGISGGLTDGFVVTGHDGTILTSTDAGETFQRVASGTALHLDAVTRWNNDFFATGTNFVLTRSNFNATTWVLDRTVNTDGRENGIVYNGLVAFNNALVIVGDQGRILDEAGRPWATSEPLFSGWRAVAASRNRVVAVGTGGGIASAPIDPNLGLEYTISPSFLVDSIVLTGLRRRAPAVSGEIYELQWQLDGKLIAGATTPTLRINTATGAANGTYSLVATTRSGSASSTASITLDPQPNPASLGLVDTGFRPDLVAPPGPMLPLAGGRLYVAGFESTLSIGDRRVNGPVRLAADGSLDPTFTVRDGALPSGQSQWLLLQPDGKLLVGLRTEVSPAKYRTFRLHVTGEVDLSFQPDALFTTDNERPILLADGRWLAVERKPIPDPVHQTFTTAWFAAVLRRFHANGTLDRSFEATELLQGFSSFPAGYKVLFTGQRTLSEQDTHGRVYLGIHFGDFGDSQSNRSGASRLFRLQADGTLDPSFTPVDLAPLHFLKATPDGLVVRTSIQSWSRLQPTVTETDLFRLKLDGSRDATFQASRLRTERSGYTRPPVGLDNDYDVLTVSPEGSIIARASSHLGHLGFIRFAPNGKLDANFNAELGADTLNVTQVHALPTGQLLVAGTFRSLLGVVRPYLARLSPNFRAAATHLTNVSVRARAGTAEATLIAGYTTQGGDTSVLARGAGPSLASFGVANPLADPQLALFSGATKVSDNDNWGSGPAAFLAATASRLGAFPFPAGSLDSALYTTSAVRAFTVHLAGKDAATGVALAELFFAGSPPVDSTSPRVVNFSVRTHAGIGDDTLIVGFTLVGDNTRNVLIRAIGPGLARFGVTDTLPDPVLTLFRETKPIAINDDWGPTFEAWVTLREAFGIVGAFPLESAESWIAPNASKDAALLISLAPGNYTAQVNGKAGATGIALVEVYEIP